MAFQQNLRCASGLRPDFHQESLGSWLRHMRGGQFESAWQISDAVLRSHAGIPCQHLPRHLQYVWDGQPLDGKRVLVRCYHGLGDTIQFIRYVSLIKSIAAEVFVWAQPRLIPLLQTVRGIDKLLALHEGSPEVSYDVDVEIMELPHIFRTTLKTIPADIPYLHVDPMPLQRDGRLAVGCVWQAGGWDERRSIPFQRLAPLAEVPGVQWHVLQHYPEMAGWRDGFGVISGGQDIFEDARILRALDLLISVDSMPAHLAGALGMPVWNLLPADADWRWMERREDSPWYPTMRLFRQEKCGEWGSLIAQVISELEQLTLWKRPASSSA
jgi:hypothetical protein